MKDLIEVVRKLGVPAALAIVLAWYLMSNVSAAIEAHDKRTIAANRVLQQICINTAIMAGKEAAGCIEK